MKKYTDLRLCDRRWIIRKIVHEHAHQVTKWGIQTRSAFEWLTYIAEELGELAQAISEHEYRKGPAEKIVREAIQVATLALKIAEMFDRTFFSPRRRRSSWSSRTISGRKRSPCWSATSGSWPITRSSGPNQKKDSWRCSDAENKD